MRSRSTRPWKEELKDLFVMHKGERRGSTILFGLCILAAAWVTYEQWIRPDRWEGSELEVAWHTLKAEGEAPRARASASSRDVELFPFDPNGLATEQWVMLGLTERQADAIHRYEEHGGRFRTKRDLAKMRVVDPGLFAQWSTYIQLPDSLPKRDPGGWAERSDLQRDEGGWSKDRSDRKADRSTREPVELNTADTTQLVELPGIGPAFARGIVKFRDRLGGFHDLDQLREVYLLRDKPEAVEQLKRLFVLDTLLMHRYPVNAFTAEELGPHPYAGWKVAKALVAYRKQHGGFKSIAEIRGCVLVTDSVYRRLAPYLMIDQ